MYRRQLDQLQLDHPDLEIPAVDEDEEEDTSHLEPDHSLWENQSTDEDEVLTTDVKLSEDEDEDDSESTNEDEDRDQQQQDQQPPPVNLSRHGATAASHPYHTLLLHSNSRISSPSTRPDDDSTTPSVDNTSVDLPVISSPHSLGFDFSGMPSDIRSPGMTQDSSDVHD